MWYFQADYEDVVSVISFITEVLNIFFLGLFSAIMLKKFFIHNHAKILLPLNNKVGVPIITMVLTLPPHCRC